MRRKAPKLCVLALQLVATGLAACDGPGEAVVEKPVEHPSPSVNEAGAPAIPPPTDEELERLLDALEHELRTVSP